MHPRPRAETFRLPSVLVFMMASLVLLRGPCAQLFSGASTPENASTASGSRAPWIWIAAAAALSSASSSGVNRTAAAPMLSRRCGHLCRTGNRDDPGLLRHQPGESDLRRAWPACARPSSLAASTSARLCGRFSGEKRDSMPADITVGEPRPCVDRAGQETHAERAPRHEADAELLAERNDLAFRPAPEHRIFALHGGDRQRGMRPAQRLQPHLRQAPMQDLALRPSDP